MQKAKVMIISQPVRKLYADVLKSALQESP